MTQHLEMEYASPSPQIINCESMPKCMESSSPVGQSPNVDNAVSRLALNLRCPEPPLCRGSRRKPHHFIALQIPQRRIPVERIRLQPPALLHVRHEILLHLAEFGAYRSSIPFDFRRSDRGFLFATDRASLPDFFFAIAM